MSFIIEQGQLGVMLRFAMAVSGQSSVLVIMSNYSRMIRVGSIANAAAIRGAPHRLSLARMWKALKPGGMWYLSASVVSCEELE